MTNETHQNRIQRLKKKYCKYNFVLFSMKCIRGEVIQVCIVLFDTIVVNNENRNVMQSERDEKIIYYH